ncbi:MAG: 50S ribosomal protein L3 [Verrucomicrobiae bacterium]|nr:50S ribosomal protein L3 [Verrucomicrobiae bacterium]MCB1232661.1 50S ribosomal protein L3 [Verrucomicrobiae bacterium]
MSIGLIGKKVGMTRIFTDEGEAIAVTVIDVSDNIFLDKKTQEKDGYTAVQVAFDAQKESRLNQPDAGQFKAHGGTPKRVVREFRLESDEQLPEVDHPGMELFEEGQWIDVIGTSKGKGFQGVMRRHNFHGQHMTHGSMMHRRPGAIAPGSTPGRVFKNQKMPGHQGVERRTVQNLKIVQKRAEDNVILISGAVPGAKGSYVIIRPAKKKEGPVQDLKAKAGDNAGGGEEAASE